MRIEFEVLNRSYPARQEPVARALRSKLYQQERELPADMLRLLVQIDRASAGRDLHAR